MCVLHCSCAAALQKQQMLAVACASVGSGAGAKRLANATAPVIQLSGAECGEYCGWNNNNQILATAMDVGGCLPLTDSALRTMFALIRICAEGDSCLGLASAALRAHVSQSL